MEEKNNGVSLSISSKAPLNGHALNGHAHEIEELPARVDAPLAAEVQEAEAPTEDWTAEERRYEPTWKPFPLIALPITVRNYVTENARGLTVDPAMVALPALCSLAACIGSSRVIRIKAKWTEPAILFGCVIGEPSSGKTNAMRAAIKPISDWDAKLHEEFREEKNAYDIDVQEWTVAKAKDPGLAGLPPEKPTRRRVIVNSITVETHIGRLYENPRGLFVVRDELRAWFASFGQYAKSGSSADECYWLEVFLGHEYNYDRKSGDYQSVRVPILMSSVFGTIQPEMWKKLSIEDMYESGMMARILLAYPPSADDDATDYDFEPAPEIDRAYEMLLSGLLNLDCEESRQPGFKPTEMVFTVEARELWRRWHKHARKERRGAEGEIAAMLGRLEQCCARFALIFATCDRVMRGEGDVVEEHHVASAIALHDWFRDEAERVYAMADVKGEATARLNLLQKILTRGGSITPNELWASNKRRWLETCRARAKLMELAGYDADGKPTEEFAKAPLVRGPRDRFFLRTHAPADIAIVLQAEPVTVSADVEWAEFVSAHRAQFPLFSGQDGSFIHGWRDALAPYTLAELLMAIKHLAADPRRVEVPKWPGLYATNHCPFLVEAIKRQRAEAANRKRSEEIAAYEKAPADGPSLFGDPGFRDFFARARKQDPTITTGRAREQFLAQNGAPAGERGLGTGGPVSS